MKILLLLIVTCLLSAVHGCIRSKKSLSSKQRGLKTWWAKDFPVDGFFIGARISRTHHKYLSEMGFKSVLSFENYMDEIAESDIPTTAQQKALVEDLGMKHGVVLPAGVTDFRDARVAGWFETAYEKLQKPVYYHCTSGFAASYSAFTYFLKKTAANSNYGDAVTINEAYNWGAANGYQYHHDMEPYRVSHRLNAAWGSAPASYPSFDNAHPFLMFCYFQPYPVYDNIFIAGQITTDQVAKLKACGITAVVNLRSNEAQANPREEVTLLNVKDGTGADRQTTANLEKNRIDSGKPNSYISPTSSVNYATSNPDEFGDAVGWSWKQEKAAVEAAGIKYFHHPMFDPFDKTWWDQKHRPHFLQFTVAANGNVLFKGRDAHRAALIALMTTRERHGKSIDWALDRGRQIGFDFTADDNYEYMLRYTLATESSSIVHQVAASTLLALLLAARFLA